MNDEMTSRTRPGHVPAHVVPGPALDDVLGGQPLYVPAEPPTPERTMAMRVHDLEARVDAQDTHIRVLHGVIDQIIEEIGELRHQLGLPPWQPEYRR